MILAFRLSDRVREREQGVADAVAPLMEAAPNIDY